jgi:hypothetical protein
MPNLDGAVNPFGMMLPSRRATPVQIIASEGSTFYQH